MKNLHTALIIILIISAASYLALILLLYFSQDKIIFHPVSKHIWNPKEAYLDYQDISIESQDNTKLNAWYIPAENAKYTILFFHGNGGNISYRSDTIVLLHEQDFNVFMVDYRSYGKSAGTISEKGLYEDSEAAWNYLTEKLKISPENIIILGRSLGGALAARTAKNHCPAGLILESTFTSMPEIAQKSMPFFPCSFMVKYSFTTCKDLQEVKCPVQIVASPDDNVVPFHFGKELYEAAPAPKIFIELTGDHDDCYFICQKKYNQALRDFQKLISSQTTKHQSKQ